jgi:hypothetical protein
MVPVIDRDVGHNDGTHINAMPGTMPRTSQTFCNSFDLHFGVVVTRDT